MKLVKHLREEKPKKKGQFLIVLLFVLNMFIWASALYLWHEARDFKPEARENFAMDMDIYERQTAQTPPRQNMALNYDEVNFQLFSHTALLINLDTGEVLFDYNGDVRRYPASVTKIMTTLLGVIHATGEEIPIYADFHALHEANSAMADFAFGEIRSLSDVLHGALLSSGGDATTSLAYHISGSYEGFIGLMNDTAAQLGMHDTHFMNATGLHHEQHYTTAYDIGLLLAYALTYPEFRDLFTTESYTFINPFGHEQLMTSIMFRNLPSPIFPGGEILGGMTGFTTPAGLCLASIATDGVNEFALITFGAPTTEIISANIQDALTVYEYFFSLE